MKGYVLVGKGKAEWQDIPVPEIGDYEALVRPTMVAACTTDIHLIKTAAWPKAINKVIGHEAVGVVERVGKYVKDFYPGDRVVLPSAGSDFWNYHAQCGEAKFHQDLNPYLSDDSSTGGVFSELVKVAQADNRLSHIPSGVSDQQALMVPDMIGTGFTGIEKLNIKFGDTVLVMGVGPVGLMGVAAAALKGAGRIIAVGSRPHTLELARHYGASDIVDYKKGDILQQVMSLTNGNTVDGVLIACGGDVSSIFTTALKAVKFGGTVACVSVFLGTDSVTIPMSVWEYGSMDKNLTGVLIQDGRYFFEKLLSMIEYKRIDPSPLITQTYRGWTQLENALDKMGSGDKDVIKVIVDVSSNE